MPRTHKRGVHKPGTLQLCKPNCKRDAAGQAETREAHKAATTSCRPSVEIDAMAGDCPRRLRRASYGS